jgi:DNA-binding SARP family transcriptional activator
MRLDGPNGALRLGRKELALLTYLACRAGRPAPRAELATLLWGESRESAARQSLRQALVRLKRAATLPLDVRADRVTLGAGEWEVDAAAFEADLAAGRLREAVGRWEGDFLAGVEDAGGEAWRLWLEVEREALRRRVGWALEQLVAEEVEVLTQRLAGDVDPDRAVELIEAGSGPLNDLIAALHTKLLVAELERHGAGRKGSGSRRR